MPAGIWRIVLPIALFSKPEFPRAPRALGDCTGSNYSHFGKWGRLSSLRSFGNLEGCQFRAGWKPCPTSPGNMA